MWGGKSSLFDDQLSRLLFASSMPTKFPSVPILLHNFIPVENASMLRGIDGDEYGPGGSVL